MKVFCKNNYYGFEKGKYYEVKSIHSIFEKDDFITIVSNESLTEISRSNRGNLSWYRFRMNQSLEYIDDYIGQNEVYFYDYFINIQEERKNKLNKISKI